MRITNGKAETNAVNLGTARGAVTIGEAADGSGVSAKLIRYYESIGLVRAVVRTGNGYRMYADADVQTLRFIKRSRSLGFSIPQIEHLLALWHDRSRASADVRALALAHVDELEKKIHELREMAETLRGLAAGCHNDERPDCPILAGIDLPGRENEAAAYARVAEPRVGATRAAPSAVRRSGSPLPAAPAWSRVPA